MSDFPIRSNRQNTLQTLQPTPAKNAPQGTQQAAYGKDEYTPLTSLQPAGGNDSGKSNPLLSLSVSDALGFLKGLQQGKQLEIAGQKISVANLEQVLSSIMQAGGGDVSVGDALAQIGSQAGAAPKVPLQNASVGQAILGLKDAPPNQVVLNTNAPGGGTQSITAGTLLAILNEVNQALGSKADNMTVMQALQFVAQASSQKPPAGG